MPAPLICNLSFAIFVFLILSYTVLFAYRKLIAMRQWDSTLGKVLVSRFEAGSFFDNRYKRNYPHVEYSYQVAGETYQSEQIALGSVNGIGARKRVARYPVGAQVIVFYNPQDPSEAVLEKKAPALWLLWWILIMMAWVIYNMISLALQVINFHS